MFNVTLGCIVPKFDQKKVGKRHKVFCVRFDVQGWVAGTFVCRGPSLKAYSYGNDTARAMTQRSPGRPHQGDHDAHCGQSTTVQTVSNDYKHEFLHSWSFVRAVCQHCTKQKVSQPSLAQVRHCGTEIESVTSLVHL